jgi:hypothetical protein
MCKLLARLKRYAFRLVSMMLRTHGKRIFLLTTLFVQLSELHNYNREKLASLNESLKLVRSEDALEFPAYFSSAIWKGRLPNDATIFSVAEPASYIVSLTPYWLRYNRDQMLDDVKKVIEMNGNHLNAVHA